MDIGRFSEIPRDNGAWEVRARAERAAQEAAAQQARDNWHRLAWDDDANDNIIGDGIDVEPPEELPVDEVALEAPPQRETVEQEQRMAAEEKLYQQLQEADNKCRTGIRSELGDLAGIPDGLTRKEFDRRMKNRTAHIRKAQQYLEEYDETVESISPGHGADMRSELAGEIARHGEGTLEILRSQKLQDDHDQRISDSRPPGFAERSVDRICNKVIEHVMREVAALAINHVAPGAGHTVVNVISGLKEALSTLNQIEHGNGLMVDIPIAIGSTGLSIDLSTKLSDKTLDNEAPHISATMDFSPDGPPQTGDPDIELVDLPEPAGPASDTSGNAEDDQVEDATEPEQHHQYRAQGEELEDVEPGDEAIDTGVTDSAHGLAEPRGDSKLEDGELADGELETPAADRPRFGEDGDKTAGEAAAGEPTDRPADLLGPGRLGIGPLDAPGPGSFATSMRPAGVVACKSAAAAARAAGTTVVDPEALLAMARREICARFYRGTPVSIVALMRALGALEVIVLVIPELACGLWVDVDPLTQSPAASLFFTITQEAGELRFEFFELRKQPPSQ